ncbi:MAG: dTDP-4-dehydrorhamnose 3,5-epimerase [Flavobacteriales bacterium]|nr:dTDP-4-dehydrorhamnose 3,5-epimerase [Flavobacteriales bacterium]|tara:strand:- start:146 stop:718 length:573 start_codon:yes stop_codon:yes gene_type:complete
MTITSTSLPEVLIIKPKRFKDKRGWFLESFRKDLLEDAVGYSLDFCQENLAQSTYGVIRGLHYQMPPHAQSKLVAILQGSVLEVVIDIRKGSPRFGEYLAVELSAEIQKQLFIPRGFAHGYACLSETALLSYKVDNHYNKAAEASIAFNDPQLNIDWQIPMEKQILSSKDREHPKFDAAQWFDYNTPLYD